MCEHYHPHATAIVTLGFAEISVGDIGQID